MIQGKKIPRIQSISKVDGFRVYCVFNTGESGSINFERLFAEWGVKPGDAEYELLDLEEFQKVKLRDGVLSWSNVTVDVSDEVDRVGLYVAPYEIDPITLYKQAEIISVKASVSDIKDDILIKLAHLKDEERLKRLLDFLNQELQTEKSAEYLS